MDALIISLHDQHWLVRLQASRALGRIGDERAIPTLLDLCQDENPSVRRRAVEALGNFDESIVIEKLEEALNDPDAGVRIYAIKGLTNLKTHHAARIIAQGMRDKNDQVAWSAANALGRIGELAVDSLLNLLSDPKREVRYKAVKVLGRIASIRAVNGLNAIYKESDEMLRHHINLSLNQIYYWDAINKKYQQD